MASDKSIWITDRFTRLHHWPDAPADVGFLRHPHRHVFVIRVWIKVEHNDRDVEFFQAKRILRSICAEWDDPYLEFEAVRASCEDIAEDILTKMRARYYSTCYKVEVSEDGENGAEVVYVPG